MKVVSGICERISRYSRAKPGAEDWSHPRPVPASRREASGHLRFRDGWRRGGWPADCMAI